MCLSLVQLEIREYILLYIIADIVLTFQTPFEEIVTALFQQAFMFPLNVTFSRF